MGAGGLGRHVWGAVHPKGAKNSRHAHSTATTTTTATAATAGSRDCTHAAAQGSQCTRSCRGYVDESVKVNSGGLSPSRLRQIPTIRTPAGSQRISCATPNRQRSAAVDKSLERRSLASSPLCQWRPRFQCYAQREDVGCITSLRVLSNLVPSFRFQFIWGLLKCMFERRLQALISLKY